nr:MAG TPA: YopX protein [Caudoviricetes sp.]
MIPKFRVWLTDIDQMLRVKALVFEKDKTRCVCGYSFDFYLEDENATIMQSTGLVDKNGKEIFEGDIVKMSKDVYSEPTYYEVVRHYGGAYRLESKQHGCELWLRHTDCEVVGNIYENRELLEDKE